jgi:hypothetical protein
VKESTGNDAPGRNCDEWPATVRRQFRVEQSPKQPRGRQHHAEVDDESRHVDERRDERCRGAGRVEPKAPELGIIVAVMSAGTLEAIVTLLAVCGQSRRQSYFDVVMVCIVGAILALAA